MNFTLALRAAFAEFRRASLLLRFASLPSCDDVRVWPMPMSASEVATFAELHGLRIVDVVRFERLRCVAPAIPPDEADGSEPRKTPTLWRITLHRQPRREVVSYSADAGWSSISTPERYIAGALDCISHSEVRDAFELRPG